MSYWVELKNIEELKKEMAFIKLLGIAILLALIAMYEWPKIEPNQKKEKAAFVILSLFAGGMLAMVLFFPEIPGPNKWMVTIFKPLGDLLEE
ncbi:hypothetical protein ACFQ88_39045 [Paenibacillus sp. NPDC056579]|uniref:hypothetical protein n=1 Tax=Paenibacillus sp. NPDC056579 TaxID=3345871 RepID=UPI00368428FB